MEAKDVRSLQEAYDSIYEGYKEKEEKEEKGEKEEKECVDKEDKGKHNCAKKVCHEQFGEGTCIFGEHAVPDENGFVSHYDVLFEHGVERNVPVADMQVLEEGSHNEDYHRYEGEMVDEGFPGVSGRQDPGEKLKLHQTPGGRRYYTGPGGREMDPVDVDKVMRGELMVKKQKPKPTTQVAHFEPEGEMVDEGMGLVTGTAKAVNAVLKPKGQTPEEGKKAVSNLTKAMDVVAKPVKDAVKGVLSVGDEKNAAMMNKRRPTAAQSAKMEEVDIFDIVKGYLIGEGATEEEVYDMMVHLTDEQRDAIVESPGEWFRGRLNPNNSVAAQAQRQSPFAQPTKSLPSTPSPFAKPASRNDSGKLTTYGAGGGAAAEAKGQTRAQVMQQGAKNLENKKRTQPVNQGPDFGR